MASIFPSKFEVQIDFSWWLSPSTPLYVCVCGFAFFFTIGYDVLGFSGILITASHIYRKIINKTHTRPLFVSVFQDLKDISKLIRVKPKSVCKLKSHSADQWDWSIYDMYDMDGACYAN